MSLPRQVLPGETHLVTRRCAQRQFLLRPSALVNQVFLYCLAVAAARFGVLVHAVCVMSNHWHLIVTDPDGRLPEFVGWLDAMVARCLNARRGRWEALWASGSYDARQLLDEPATLGGIGYTLANPVAAGLVREGHQWPGVRLGFGIDAGVGPGCGFRLDRDQDGQYFEVRRPHFFFRQTGPLPEMACLRLTPPPPSLRVQSEEVFAAAVRTEVQRREAEARAEADRAKRSFLGRRAVLAQSPADRPTTWEPRRAVCRQRCTEAVCRKKAFVAAYREAWLRFRGGMRDALFPAGTYALRLHLGVRCASP